MTKTVTEWIWRLAVLCALAWIGLQLQRLHDDISQPAEDDAAVAAASDDIQDSLDAIHDDLDGLSTKVDAIMVAMARAPR